MPGCVQCYKNSAKKILLAVSALTLLVWHHKGNPVCKKLSGKVLACLSVCSEVQMICVLSS